MNVRTIEDVEAELAAWKNRTYCAYCGHEENFDADGAVIAEHIRTCSKHPMRALEVAHAELRDAARQAFDALVGACASPDSVQGRARDRLRPFIL